MLKKISEHVASWIQKLYSACVIVCKYALKTDKVFIFGILFSILAWYWQTSILPQIKDEIEFYNQALDRFNRTSTEIQNIRFREDLILLNRNGYIAGARNTKEGITDSAWIFKERLLVSNNEEARVSVDCMVAYNEIKDGLDSVSANRRFKKYEDSVITSYERVIDSARKEDAQYRDSLRWLEYQDLYIHNLANRNVMPERAAECLEKGKVRFEELEEIYTSKNTWSQAFFYLGTILIGLSKIIEYRKNISNL